MPIQQFDAPGKAPDLTPELQTAWSDKINEMIEGERANLPARFRKFFFNELQHPEAENGPVAPITWEGFPRFWLLRFPNDQQQRWEASEKIYQTNEGTPFRQQDEYLEWKTFSRDGQLEKIVFTCEGPDYWRFIAESDEALLLSMYHQYVSLDVELQDLFVDTPDGRQYNGSNKWNMTDGIAHLTHPANTLGAEVNLAAGATVLRRKGTVDPVTDTHDLICCSGFGSESRFSDPTIGAGVNSFVRQGLSVTLNNPIGLYIRSLDTSGIEVPGEFQVKDFWKVIRGDEGQKMVLRAEFSAPEGSGVRLEDVLVGGVPLQFGAQLAEIIEMVIYGKAFKLENTVPASAACGNHCGETQPANESAPLGFDGETDDDESMTTSGLRKISPEIREVGADD